MLVRLVVVVMVEVSLGLSRPDIVALLFVCFLLVILSQKRRFLVDLVSETFDVNRVVSLLNDDDDESIRFTFVDDDVHPVMSHRHRPPQFGTC